MADEYIKREAVISRIKELKSADPSQIGKKQFADGFFVGLDEADTVLRQVPAASVAPVIFCRECAHHGLCAAESIYLSEGIAEPFCCRGEPKDGDGNG